MRVWSSIRGLHWKQHDYKMVSSQCRLKPYVLIVISKLELILWKQTLSGFLVCFLPPTTYCQISLKGNRFPSLILKKMSTKVGSSVHDLSPLLFLGKKDISFPRDKRGEERRRKKSEKKDSCNSITHNLGSGGRRITSLKYQPGLNNETLY